SPEPFGPIYDAGTFTVNLVSNSRSRFLRARISVEVDGRKALEELQTREPAVRDAIIATLRSYTPAQLADADGTAALTEHREEVAAREPAVRDGLIATPRSYTPAQLADADGIGALKEQLEQVLSDMLPEGRVKRVYFQEFLTQ